MWQRALLCVGAFSCALWVGAASGEEAASAATTAKPEDAPARPLKPRKGTRKSADIYVLGSSSIGGRLGRDVGKVFSERGHSVYRYGRRSTGFARPDFFDWWKEVERMPGLARARGAIFYMGVNDVFGVWLRPEEREGGRKGPKWVNPHDERWHDAYRDRVASLVQKLCDMGTGRVVLLTPMDVADTMRQKRLGPIREAQKAAAEQTTCGVAVATDGDIADILASDRKRNALRTADGNHATGKGTRIILERISAPLVEAILRPEVGVEAPTPAEHAPPPPVWDAEDLPAGDPLKKVFEEKQVNTGS